MKKKDQNRNTGFSIIELIIVFTIMSVLTTIFAASFFRHLENSHKTGAITSAEAIYKTAQYALIDLSTKPSSAFQNSLNYQETINGQNVRLGRFTSQSLYQYAQSHDGTESTDSLLAQGADTFLAAQLSGSEISPDMVANKMPIGDGNHTQYIANHSNEYGDVVFALAYDGYGQIVYFQCVCDGYFVSWEGNQMTTAEKASQSTHFNSWPQTFAGVE